MRKMKRSILFALAMAAGLSLSGCQKAKNSVNKFMDGVQTISADTEGSLACTPVKLEDGTKYQDAEARLTFTADYPTDDSKAAIMLRRWLYENCFGEPCTDDIKDGQAFFDKLLAKYKQENSPEMIKSALEDGFDGGWFYNIRFKKEWENEHVVSYTYSADAFNVGNATSSAWIKDNTVSKADGRTLGWDMFKSKTDVKSAIDDVLVTKYGREGADMYDQGIPMPDAPLFLADGVRFDYGDYSIVTPHVYEETGEYPCCLLSYDAYRQLLTDEARELLGLQ